MLNQLEMGGRIASKALANELKSKYSNHSSQNNATNLQGVSRQTIECSSDTLRHSSHCRYTKSRQSRNRYNFFDHFDLLEK